MQIDNLVPGDDFDLFLDGTFTRAAQIVEARLLVMSQDRASTPIDVTITTMDQTYGIIDVDGSAGPFALHFVLPPALTGQLTGESVYLWGCSVLTSLGRQYSPVPQAFLFTTKARLVSQP